MAIYLANFEGDPVIFGEREAWTFVAGQWRRMNYADAFCKAKTVDQVAFDAVFPELPPLPAKALATESE